jgi:hypothetical protein
MKSFLIACVAAVCLALVGSVALEGIQEPAYEAFSTSTVRLSN